jgi:hypothetical protein
LCEHSRSNIFSGIQVNADDFEQKKDDFAFYYGFKLRQILSSAMPAQDFNAACVNLLMMASSIDEAQKVSIFKRITIGLPPNDRMGGTPLNETIITAIELIQPLRKKYQVVNTIFITDGEATTDHRYVGNDDGDTLPIDHFKETVFLKDSVTHMNYPLSPISMENTSQFLQILRSRTGVNAIGFFIAGGDKEEKAHAFEMLCPTRWETEEGQEKLWSELEKNGFVLVPDQGYNEFYIIPGGKELRIYLPKNPLAHNVAMTNRQMVTTMTDHGIQQRKQRIVLTRFIKLIS